MKVSMKQYFSTILRSIEELKEENKQLTAEVFYLNQRLEKHLTGGKVGPKVGPKVVPQESARPHLPDGFTFPLQTTKQLEQLNDHLEDETAKKRLVNRPVVAMTSISVPAWKTRLKF